MARTLYCARCLNSFTTDTPTCPNLACGADRPELGWGRLLGAGDLLDRRYRVHERLAVGGAGITYRAREVGDDAKETGPHLAIKVLFQRGDGTWLRRLANEARVLQELAHPHIVASRGFVQRTGHPAYLVTVYEPGGNLFDHVRQVGALTLEAALGVFRQVLQALSVAHARGVIHRDLKPQNLFLRERVDRATVPHVLVADFGIAKVQGFLGEHLTTTGMFVGTPEFAAPEQFKGLPPEPPSDVFAAACVFWFCLTGSPPVPLPDRTDLVASLRALRAGLPPRLPPGICGPLQAAPLEKLVARTLTNEASDRATIPEILDALEDFPRDPTRPLDREPMATLAPDALQPLEDTTLDPALLQDPTTTHETPLAEPEPEAEPDASPGVEPPPSSPPSTTGTAPSPTPGRLRLDRKAAPATPAPQPATPRAIDDSLEALFDTPAVDDTGIVDVSAPSRSEVSLDDLFASPPDPAPQAVDPAPPAPPPPSPSAPVLDATWETLATPPAAPAAEPPPAIEPTPAVEPEPPPPIEPEAPAEPAPPWTPAHPVDPGDPDTDAARLEAVGACPVAAREAILEALEDPTAAVKAVGPTASAAMLCGASLAVAHHALGPLARWAQQLLTHADPDVRATAALAVGGSGTTGQLARLNRLLDDPDARVRLATVHALRTLGDRTGRQDMVRGWLQAVASDPDPRVQTAAR
jgi:serine/threonine-protein kinase